MKKTVLNAILIVFLLKLTRILAATTPDNTIQFDKNTKIYDLDVSKSYICVLVQRQNSPWFSAYLYDRNGQVRFEYVSDTIYIVKAAVIEQYNSFLIVVRGSTLPLEDSKSPEVIKAFDIKTKKLIWQTTAYAFSYEISPDQKWMITAVPTWARHPSDYGSELICLNDGSKKSIRGPYGRSAFLNNENVVLSSQEWMENPDYNDQGFSKLELEEHAIVDSILHLRWIYENKVIEITKNDFEERKKKLEEKRDNIYKKMHELRTQPIIDNRSIEVGRMLKPLPLRSIPKCIKLSIYNIEKENIVKESSIFSEKGGIIWGFEEPTIGSINIDGTGGIYIFADIRDSTTWGRSIIKFDRNFKLIWQRNLDEYDNVNKICHGDEFHFYIHRMGNQGYLIDNENGRDIEISDFISRYNNIQLSDIEKSRPNDITKVFKYINVDIKTAKITFVQ
jgi:hypothetical protein